MKQFINNFLARKNILIRKLLPRPSVLFAKEHFKGKGIKVCEIGTYIGYNAKSMFEVLNVEDMVCIDPYETYDDDKQLDIELLKKAREESYNVLKEHEGSINRVFKKSNDAFKMNLDYSGLHKIFFDFIYLDGDHTYESVKSDMNNYWRLLNKGGIIAGHDVDFEGVFKAVGEFALKNNLKIHLRFPDWWIVK